MSYPTELAGDDATPPTSPSPRARAMALEQARRSAPDLEDDSPLYGAGDWRMAASLVVLGDEANHANPTRDKSSDGTIGDARHQALPPGSTDHVPWLRHNGSGICRARDIDSSGLDLAAAFERARWLAHHGHLPQLRGGGYLIFAGKISRPDFSGWARYKGNNPHVLMGHVSVSTDPERFDDRSPWGIFDTGPAKPPAKPQPEPATKPPARINARLLTVGPGHYKPGDPRHALTRRVQTKLRTVFPLYAKHLRTDGLYGPKTAAAVQQFQRRSPGLKADGVCGPATLRRLGL